MKWRGHLARGLAQVAPTDTSETPVPRNLRLNSEHLLSGLIVS
jgi:hypothetical protein